MFEVGKSYKTVGGHKATVVHAEKEAVDGGYLFVAVHYLGKTRAVYWHKEDGFSSSSAFKTSLLKEEWQEPIIKTGYANIYYAKIHGEYGNPYIGSTYSSLIDAKIHGDLNLDILAGQIKLVYNSSKPKGKQIEITIL